ncbi:hypothetical protein PYCC9005_002573 [Savitreella phatthalungensis]
MFVVALFAALSGAERHSAGYVVSSRSLSSHVDALIHPVVLEGLEVRGWLSRPFHRLNGVVLDAMSEASLVSALQQTKGLIVEEDFVNIGATHERRIQSRTSWALQRISQETPIDNVPPLDELPTIYQYTYDDSSSGAGVSIYVLDSSFECGPSSEYGSRVRCLEVPQLKHIGNENEGQIKAYHGGAMTAIAASASFGVAKRASVVSVRVMHDNGWVTLRSAISGIEAALADIGKRRRPAVISASWGLAVYDSLNDAADRATALDVPFLSSAGNRAEDSCTKSPQSAASVLVVGGTNVNDQFVSWSGHGPCVKLLAPAQDIAVPDFETGRRYISRHGTSMSAAMTAGVAACWLSRLSRSRWQQHELYSWLQVTGEYNVISDVPGGTTNILLQSPK